MHKQLYEFISQQTDDPIIERCACKLSQEKFAIFQSDIKFYQSMSLYSQHVPKPNLSPRERERRRLARRNERNLYKRICDASGKPMISIYKPNNDYKVYSQSERRSDKWNALEYGQDWDNNTSFFAQFDTLLHRTPLLGLIGANNENSQYINLAADNKNCYIVIESSNNEDCYHCYWIQKCKDCCDISFSHGCQHCYEIDNCFYCYDLQHSIDCQQCRQSMLLDNCSNCDHCFGCVNLHNAQYHIFNEKVDKQTYEDFIHNFHNHYQKLRQKYQHTFQELQNKSPKKYAHITHSEQSFGDYLDHTNNCIRCVDSYDAQDCKYGEHVRRNAKKCMDVSTAGRNAELIYESINTGIDAYHNAFCAVAWTCRDTRYSYNCFNCQDCFGCISLHNQQYCILNKQYTKKEYETLVPQIITHMQASHEWGEFFPASLSPFAYNETMAHAYYPLTQEEVQQQGYQRYTQEDTIKDTAQAIEATSIDTNITNVSDDILHHILLCEKTNKPYRIVKAELVFYRTHKLPIPTKHPDVRHMERMQRRTGRDFYLRQCDKTNKKLLSVYPSDVPFAVYSEAAYNEVIYS